MKHRGVVSPAPVGLVEKGPLIQVALAPIPAVRSLLGVTGNEPSVIAKMMIDTGAELMVVENAIAKRLGLPPIRFIPIVGVSQISQECPVYRTTITFGVENNSAKAEITVEIDVVGVASPALPSDHVGLLGRDFLANFQLIYDGPKGLYDIV